ncbi:MAG: Vitamin B12 import ATP-binding protein BtuD [Desulfovibrio sp.]
MDTPVTIEHLRHNYGDHLVYSDLNLTFERGKIYGLLGKNGVGKTTLIKILMGFLKPAGGECRIFGDPAHSISPATRARVGLLFENHLAYDFFSIEDIERFHARFYPRWRSDVFWDMAGKLKLSKTHRIRNMSEGQRSQVVLGLLLAQNPELLILDDYSMGLDAGYRRLFVDYLAEHLKDGNHTVILTSHVIQDMETFVDEAVFLKRGGFTHRTSLKTFMETFTRFQLPVAEESDAVPVPSDCIVNVERHPAYCDIFSFNSLEDVRYDLERQGFSGAALTPVLMTLEDAFIGYTGRY